jgi:hypothetical protein
VLIRGENYTVQMTPSFGSYKFAYWKDSDSANPVRSIFLNGNTTIIAVYEET